MSYIGTLAGYISSVQYAAVPAWATGVSKSIGNFIRQTAPSVDNERVFMCISAGTTAASEPTWDVSKGHKTTESGGPVWIECTGQPAINGDFTNTPNWTGVRNKSVDLGHIIKDNAGTHLFIVTTAGNTNNTAEPTWNVSAVGNTTTDNTTTWMYIGTSFAAWSAPFARVKQCALWGVNGDTYQYFVGSDHAETQASAWNMSNGSSSQTTTFGSNQSGPVVVVCVNVAGSTPPVSADLTNTATLTTTGSNGQTLSFGYMRWGYGLNFISGTSAGISLDCGGSEAKDKFYENCKFTLGTGTTSGGLIRVNNNEGHGKIRFKSCTFKFANIGQSMATASHTVFENCTFDTSAAIPSRLFQNSDSGCYVRVAGSDLSALTGDFVYNGGGGTGWTYDFVDCKLPTSFTLGEMFDNYTAGRINLVRCDNGSVTYKNSAQDRSGLLTTDAGIVRTGGAGDGTTAFSWKVVTTAFALSPSQPFDCPAIANDNATTGSTVNVTLYGVVNAAALPTVDDVNMNVRYLGTSGNPQAAFKNTRRTDFLATSSVSSLTADSTSAWDSAATARANSHAYSVGDIIAVASNPGRIFFCISAGTSAGSEPGGYATAVDGGSVTDSGATFRAGVRFSFTVALSSPNPALAGPIYTTVSFGKASTTYFLDPAAVLS